MHRWLVKTIGSENERRCQNGELQLREQIGAQSPALLSLSGEMAASPEEDVFQDLDSDAELDSDEGGEFDDDPQFSDSESASVLQLLSVDRDDRVSLDSTPPPGRHPDQQRDERQQTQRDTVDDTVQLLEEMFPMEATNNEGKTKVNNTKADVSTSRATLAADTAATNSEFAELLEEMYGDQVPREDEYGSDEESWTPVSSETPSYQQHEQAEIDAESGLTRLGSMDDLPPDIHQLATELFDAATWASDIPVSKCSPNTEDLTRWCSQNGMTVHSLVMAAHDLLQIPCNDNDIDAVSTSPLANADETHVFVRAVNYTEACLAQQPFVSYFAPTREERFVGNSLSRSLMAC